MPKILAAGALAALLTLASAARVHAQTPPDELVREVSADIIETAKNDKEIQAGNPTRILEIVDEKVMPRLNFEVITRSAVGPQWRSATPEQRQRLQTEFKTLLVRVYAGALKQARDQTVAVTKTQAVPGSSQVVVQSEVRGGSTPEPVRIDYRLDKEGDTWKVIDVNVGGIWLVTSYRSQFAQELANGGIDKLIATLAERNKAVAPAAPTKS